MFKMMRGQGGKQINVPNNQTLRLKGYRLCGQGAGQRLEGGGGLLEKECASSGFSRWGYFRRGYPKRILEEI
jgi:hypothetical protein